MTDPHEDLAYRSGLDTAHGGNILTEGDIEADELVRQEVESAVATLRVTSGSLIVERKEKA